MATWCLAAKKLAYPVFGVIAQEVWNGCALKGQQAYSPGQSVATPWVLDTHGSPRPGCEADELANKGQKRDI